MADGDKYISNLPIVSQFSSSDLMYLAIPNSASDYGYTLCKMTSAELGDYLNDSLSYSSKLQTTAKNIIGAINEVAQSSGGGISIVDTLEAGETTITFNNVAITSNSTIDYYTSVFGVSPTNAVVSTGSVTLTFDSQANDIDVKVVIT